jgi:hypothetical protein
MDRRIARVLWTATCGGLFLAPVAHAGPKHKAETAKAPIEVTVENGCPTALDLMLGTTPIKVDANGKSAPVLLPPDAGEGVYALQLQGDKPTELARLGIPAGAKYAIRVDSCRPGAADIYTRLDSVQSPSPQAAAKVRFRARQQDVRLEYQVGTGRFLPLSIAMTRYQESPPGASDLTVRQRMAADGPVIKTVKKSLTLEPGHQYLIEASVVNGDLVFSQEDEGAATAGKGG